MKLKKLEILGFKSFPEKAAIQFPPGISAVVGPNGCGKSNIVDALRWVMGEQSVKQLRGKSMEDVIFSGTNGKAPLNMAEVSLTLMNDNGSAPEELKDFTEIMVTRRLYRSGESAYFLNKQPCRLKDIHNLFLGSGMGAKSYAVIQQGNIGAITDAGPDERRVFIEEAAGITRYKQRKTEALRKVAATDQNLLRLADIISEIKRQMASLKRQARKAEIYRSFQDRIRNLDARISIVKFDESEKQIRETHGLLEALKDTDLEHTSEIRKLDALIEEIRLERTEKNREISEERSNIFEMQRTTDRSENDLQHLRRDQERLLQEAENLKEALGNLDKKNQQVRGEIGETEQQIQRLHDMVDAEKQNIEQERAASQGIREKLAAVQEQQESRKRKLMDLVATEARYRNTYQNASNNRDSLKRRLKKADEEEALAVRKVEALNQQQQALQQRFEAQKTEQAELDSEIARDRDLLTKRNGELAHQVKTVQTIEMQRNENRSALAALQKMEDGFEWYRDGVKAVMKQRKASTPGSENALLNEDSILGLVADILEPHPSYENAVESVFGESLQCILVKDRSTGLSAMDFLRQTAAGRGGFLPFDSFRKDSVHQSTSLPEGQWLADHVDAQPEYAKMVASFLEGVIVVPDTKSATRVFDAHEGRFAVVTMDGDMLYRDGLMKGGSKEKLTGILVKKQEIKKLKRRIKSLEDQLAKEKDRQVELENNVREQERKLQEKIEYRNSVERQLAEIDKELYRIGEEAKHEKRHLDIIRLEQERLMGEESDIEEELTEYNAALSEIQADVEKTQQAVVQLSAEIQTLSSRLEIDDRKIMDLKLRVTSLTAEKDNSQKTLRRLKEYLDDGAQQLANLESEIQKKESRRASVTSEIGQLEKSISGMYDELKHMQTKLESDESIFQAIDEKLRNNDSRISDIQGKREKNQQKLRMLEVELAERRSRKDNIAAGIYERYQVALSEFRIKLDADEMFADLDLAEMENELSRCRSKISNIHDVNLGAIREYEQLKERYDFLVEQQADLVKAVEDLHKVIRKINRITRERFVNTFQLINEKLKEVFPALFEGGSAELRLTRPDDPLETGVEFLVHPPGKKLTRMSLLSGGEKALSAIAFIFSIFLIRPASFCLLDEIDAPLDEANIFRFNNLLKIIGKQSQIVMITHNKRSMEFADMLFGVTMMKKGISQIVSVNLGISGAAAPPPA